MSEDKERDEPQQSEQQTEQARLTRRRLLEVFGFGTAAALLLGTRQVEAYVPPSTELPADSKEGATEEESDDPVERVQYWRRRRRRYWRRRRRWWRPRRRWWRRRRRRYWRRRRRWMRRRFY
jgi:hypothetical protein